MNILNGCKLTYFGLAGRAESIRLALSMGGIPFHDERIEFSQWSALKPSTPWGSVPVLTLADGTTKLAQQRAILRFVGKETGLYPTNDHLAAAKIDEIMDGAEDLSGVVTKVGQELTGEEKIKARVAACEDGGVICNLFQRIDAKIGQNTTSSFAVGGSITIADLFLFATISFIIGGFYDGVPTDATDKFVNITALRKAVRSDPLVCKYYDELDPDIASKLPASFAKF